jgi:hypothetical protein
VLSGLGVWDLDQDGLNDEHDVAVWDEAGRVVAAAKVAAGAETTLIGEFRYAKFEPIPLEAGRTYVIGAHYRTPLKDCHVDGCSAITFFCDDRIQWLNRRRVIADELALPEAADPFAGTFGPNLLLQPADDATPRGSEHYAWVRERGEWKLVRAGMLDKRE